MHRTPGRPSSGGLGKCVEHGKTGKDALNKALPRVFFCLLGASVIQTRSRRGVGQWSIGAVPHNHRWINTGPSQFLRRYPLCSRFDPLPAQESCLSQ